MGLLYSESQIPNATLRPTGLFPNLVHVSVPHNIICKDGTAPLVKPKCVCISKPGFATNCFTKSDFSWFIAIAKLTLQLIKFVSDAHDESYNIRTGMEYFFHNNDNVFESFKFWETFPCCESYLFYSFRVIRHWLLFTKWGLCSSWSLS